MYICHDDKQDREYCQEKGTIYKGQLLSKRFYLNFYESVGKIQDSIMKDRIKYGYDYRPSDS